MNKTAWLGFATLLVLGCNQGEPAPNIEQESAVSECGGFAANSTARAAGDYCDAEILYWQYDSETETLSLDDQRVVLNCCGEHSMTLVEEDGVYIATERDAPEYQDARCGCECVFDFQVDGHGIPTGTISLQVIRDVTDQGDPVTVLDETLDLSQGAGSFVIDPEPSMWCGDGTAD